MKQTAVEWLEKKISLYVERCSLQKEFEQAKEIEKQQIIDSFNEGFKDNGLNFLNGEQYYNETFKK